MTVATLPWPKVSVAPRKALPNAFNRRRDRKKRELERRVRIEKALLRLTSLQARVLRLYYGLEGWKPMTFQEISRIMAIRSPDAVRSLHWRAIRAIRGNLRLYRSLKPYH